METIYFLAEYIGSFKISKSLSYLQFARIHVSRRKWNTAHFGCFIMFARTGVMLAACPQNPDNKMRHVRRKWGMLCDPRRNELRHAAVNVTLISFWMKLKDGESRARDCCFAGVHTWYTRPYWDSYQHGVLPSSFMTSYQKFTTFLLYFLLVLLCLYVSTFAHHLFDHVFRSTDS